MEGEGYVFSSFIDELSDGISFLIVVFSVLW